MNWTVHTIGATGFFIVGYYVLVVASKIYRELWQIHHFIPEWSYQFKKYINHVIGLFLALEIAGALKVLDSGSLVEWLAAFYMMAYFLSLFWDFKNMDIMMIRK